MAGLERRRERSDSEKQMGVTGGEQYLPMCHMSRRKITTTIYITYEQDKKLKELHARTRVPVAEYIRQGIDLILSQNEEKLITQLELYTPSRMNPEVG